MGCGLTIAATLMWLASACSQLVVNSTPNQPSKVANAPTTESKLSSTMPATNTTTNEVTEPPIISTPETSTTEMPTTTTKPAVTLPSVVNAAPSTTTAPFDINSYRLTINGLVNNSLSLSYAQIESYPTVTESVELVCPGIEDETDEWTGVPLVTLLNVAGLSPGASEFVFTGADGYNIQLPLEAVQQSGVFLAYQINGLATQEARGYPLRLVVSGGPGLDWVEWLTSIEVKPIQVSFSNPSAVMSKLVINVPASGSKSCSCLFSAVVKNQT
jgi:DMSO/TMAO reductase YedYZ molybdopterin-dependent catalytic subunit